jgi:hypothetical protein
MHLAFSARLNSFLDQLAGVRVPQSILRAISPAVFAADWLSTSYFHYNYSGWAANSILQETKDEGNDDSKTEDSEESKDEPKEEEEAGAEEAEDAEEEEEEEEEDEEEEEQDPKEKFEEGLSTYIPSCQIPEASVTIDIDSGATAAHGPWLRVSLEICINTTSQSARTPSNARRPSTTTTSALSESLRPRNQAMVLRRTVLKNVSWALHTGVWHNGTWGLG